MYLIMDQTMGTMGDLIGFDGYLNTTTPFLTTEHTTSWKSDRKYWDFHIGNNHNDSSNCKYPRFWLETGERVGQDVMSRFNGCYDSEFDHYGDTEAFGVFPDWQRQLSKFASVQDRLREWHDSTRDKIKHFSCLTLQMLDVDGMRLDKATQVTVDALGDWSNHMRNCAKDLGKDNFFIPGEITGGDTFGSIYIGRGREPEMRPPNPTAGIKLDGNSPAQYYIRDKGFNSLDSAAFHYSVYRSMTRFLGMDGNLEAGYDAPTNWVDMWNTMLRTNDLVNPNTGNFDPRHMLGVTNQDLFRWPAIANGTERMLLGMFIANLHMPGIPLMYYGEEQNMYLLDNTASNYIFGRQPMSPSTAWQNHGCYSLGSAQYFQWPLEKALAGCHDDWNSNDHRDPSAPVRNTMKHMFQMRKNYPVLNDGAFLQQLSNQTYEVQYKGSNKTVTETGLWSTVRSAFPKVQDLGGGNQSIWLVYTNENKTKTYNFDCRSARDGLIAPFRAGTKVKNLFFPHDEYTLEASSVKLGDGTADNSGCLSTLVDFSAWGFKAFVPSEAFLPPGPMITKFLPGHDARIYTQVPAGQRDTVPIEFHFNAEMDCDKLTQGISINSTTEDGSVASLDLSTVSCSTVNATDLPQFVGGLASAFAYKVTLKDVANGIHRVTVNKAVTKGGKTSTDAVDHFFFRIGQGDNPMIFPRLANYTTGVLSRDSGNNMQIKHKAPGADSFRYTSDWMTSWSDWEPYKGGVTQLKPTNWTGTDLQAWDGDHVIIQYHSKMVGSSSHYQHTDLNMKNPVPRRFPHLWALGPFNQYGFDAGLNSQFSLEQDGRWKYTFLHEWPTKFQVNAWGVNPSGQPDQTWVLGDVDNDTVLDRMPPSSLGDTAVFIGAFKDANPDTALKQTAIIPPPPSPYLAYTMSLNDATYKFELIPVGSRWAQLILYVLLWIVPVATGAFGIWMFMKSFYQVKFNQVGVTEKRALIPMALKRRFKRLGSDADDGAGVSLMKFGNKSATGLNASTNALGAAAGAANRRTVLISTMEYDIEDWAIKIKIGGLGVMAQLMGKNLGHQDLIWVVPCVGGVEYPWTDAELGESMTVKVLGRPFDVEVHYHVLRNITYVLLDAPVFRQQTKSEPYPPRMDDLDSAIYYSAWNQCVALSIKRFPIDLYHINDYHGAVAPVYLLPEVIPCCLSLHNAEFQGLWPMRTPKEREEVCQVYNLDPEVCQKYVQFGDVFNLLHAGASYLRIHQKGFGAVGVSKKYGKRSWARYPIFWGLNKIGTLPNPDPSDTAEWSGEASKEVITVDQNFEAGRAELKRQAQEWAGLDQNPDAELLVFVGRWSMQKGVDLIADIMPVILEENQKVQLICVGPVIDLYGKFAALKLNVMMDKYPGRVFSKPEFTALPPYIFSGAEFALIPSRDEPFGLVAVEFGRKGALGIGARVGGLGQMPGWWFTVESTTTTHMLHQFKSACREALASSRQTRAMMRARSAKQRFPVAQWVEDLEKLQTTSIKISQREFEKVRNNHVSAFYNSPMVTRPHSPIRPGSPSGADSPNGYYRPTSRSGGNSAANSGYFPPGPLHSAEQSRTSSPARVGPPADGSGLKRSLSLGIRAGPGHVNKGERAVTPGGGTGNTVGIAISNIDEEDEEDPINDYMDEYTLTEEELNRLQQGGRLPGDGSSRGRGPPMMRTPNDSSVNLKGMGGYLTPGSRNDSSANLRHSAMSEMMIPRSPIMQNAFDPGLAPPTTDFAKAQNRLSSASVLSLGSVIGDKKDFNLQKVDPNFTDADGKFYKAFEHNLQTLDGHSSEYQLCIEDFLVKSEKTWFGDFRAAKLGKPRATDNSSMYKYKPKAEKEGSIFNEDLSNLSAADSTESPKDGAPQDQFLLGENYKPPTGVRRFMMQRVGDWPIYSFFLGFGQIIAANSYQITLLSGEVGQTATKLYAVATIYLLASIFWWLIFRTLKSVYCLSIPFIFYGLGFAAIGLAHFVPSIIGRGWIQNVGTGFYAIASASGSIFFALNFGDEGGSPVKAWVYRACVIQGTQQIYVVALWYWGSRLTALQSAGALGVQPIANSMTITFITIPIAVIMWICGILMFLGLPNYYRQSPGKVPSFYHSLLRRKIIGWFFVTVLVQNFWMSAPYGRNWAYLFSSQWAPVWAIFVLCAVFFIGAWAGFLAVFSHLSKDHSWILPVFAIGLGAPRWGQMLWGISGVGNYVPWAVNPIASALVGRSLWLWLGVLDAIQGVGFGMILLQTLTRIHISFTLIAAQVLGSIATMLARAIAPNNIGPGPVFPDFSAGYGGLANAWFWIALIMQLGICIGFFTFFRKEQLSKP